MIVVAETVADCLANDLRDVVASGGLRRLRSTERPFIASDSGSGSVQWRLKDSSPAGSRLYPQSVWGCVCQSKLFEML